MPIIYGCGRGRIHRELQTIHDPENPKRSIYSPPKRATERPEQRKAVTVIDMETGEAYQCVSIREAASAIGCSVTQVRARVNRTAKSPIYGRYAVAVPAKQ
jgi:hypothetical protein